MKRFVQFGGVLLALGMLLASCNIGMGDAQVSGDSVRNTSNVEGITLRIDQITNTGRTILPADWTSTTASKLTYVLLAKKSTGASGYETKKTFSYSELTGGTAVVNLDLVIWDLKLIGYITETSGTGADTTKPCLEKELTNVDLSTGRKTVSFDLKPVTEDTDATGNVDVTIAWLTTKPQRLEFGIYKLGKSTEEIVKDKGRTDAEFSEIKTTDDFAADGTAYKYSWQQDDVDVGMYNFAAVFYDAEEDGNVIGYYIDYLYVDGGNDSIAPVNYGDKFNTQPENPNWLAVETVFVPQELTATDTTVNDWYYAKFHWDDNSNNETGFELIITDDATTPNTYVINPTTLATSSLFSDKWHDGTTETTFNTTTEPNTIDAGRTWVVLKLKTETLYTAKIRAINSMTPVYTDTSAKFCDNLNRNGDGSGRSYAPIVTEGTGTTVKKQFGMFTVNYDLNGGTVTKPDKSTTADTVTNYVVGFNYHSEQQDLMTDNTLAYPHVSKTGFLFGYWEDENATPTSAKVEVIPAKNKGNLELTAVWGGSDIRVSVTFPSYADAADVKIAANQNSENTVVFKYSTTNNSISVTAGASLTTPAFELTEVGDNGKKVTTGTTVAGSVWTWTPTAAPTAGFYCLQITGKYKDAGSGRELTLSGNVYIEVQN